MKVHSVYLGLLAATSSVVSAVPSTSIKTGTATKAALSKADSTPACVNGKKVHDTQCKAECNTDRPGGDYETLKVTSFQACALACSQDGRCLAAQYHADSQHCYLKGSVHDVQKKDGVDGIFCRSVPLSATSSAKQKLAASTTTIATRSALTTSTTTSVKRQTASTTRASVTISVSRTSKTPFEGSTSTTRKSLHATSKTSSTTASTISTLSTQTTTTIVAAATTTTTTSSTTSTTTTTVPLPDIPSLKGDCVWGDQGYGYATCKEYCITDLKDAAFYKSLQLDSYEACAATCYYDGDCLSGRYDVDTKNCSLEAFGNFDSYWVSASNVNIAKCRDVPETSIPPVPSPTPTPNPSNFHCKATLPQGSEGSYYKETFADHGVTISVQVTVEDWRLPCTDGFEPTRNLTLDADLTTCQAMERCGVFAASYFYAQYPDRDWRSSNFMLQQDLSTGKWTCTSYYNFQETSRTPNTGVGEVYVYELGGFPWRETATTSPTQIPLPPPTSVPDLSTLTGQCLWGRDGAGGHAYGYCSGGCRIDWPATVYKAVRVRSFEACAATCYYDGNCFRAKYDDRTSVCSLTQMTLDEYQQPAVFNNHSNSIYCRLDRQGCVPPPAPRPVGYPNDLCKYSEPVGPDGGQFYYYHWVSESLPVVPGRRMSDETLASPYWRAKTLLIDANASICEAVTACSDFAAIQANDPDRYNFAYGEYELHRIISNQTWVCNIADYSLQDPSCFVSDPNVGENYYYTSFSTPWADGKPW